MQKQTVRYSPIAQSVERVTVNHDVVGSSPTWGAKKNRAEQKFCSIFFRFNEWTRKAEIGKDPNGLFPAVARQGEYNFLKCHLSWMSVFLFVYLLDENYPKGHARTATALLEITSDCLLQK